MTERYSYLPLKSALREIRVLELIAGEPDEPIHCLLSHATLSVDAEYNALSYVWNQSSNAKPSDSFITLDAHRVKVTPNLYSALRHLRPTRGQASLLLWVYAVCINQDDLIERNEQVALMRSIYASATQVIVWLGDADEESDIAFDVMPLLADITKTPLSVDPAQVPGCAQTASFFFNLEYQRPWFWRVWCMQELAMATGDPLVACGWKRVSWTTFRGAWERLASTAHFLPALKPLPRSSHGTGDTDGGESERLLLSKVDVLSELRDSVQTQGGFSLRKLLIASRTSAATDPRDRIYGLLGLLKADAPGAATSEVISVDYQKSCAEVYTDAMAHIFSAGDGPYYLSAVYLPGTSTMAPKIPSNSELEEHTLLPSWVPDFSRQKSELTTQPQGNAFHPPTSMHASGAGAGANNGRVLDDRRTVQAEGLLIDTIDEVFPMGSSLEVVVSSLKMFETKAADAKRRPCKFDVRIEPYMKRFKASEPLWRTLISNKDFKSGYDAAPSAYQSQYLSLLEEDPKSTVINQQIGYVHALQSCVGRKSFCITTSGFVGTCCREACKGDDLAIIFGSPIPFVLRPIKGPTPASHRYEDAHALIGGAYIGGIMGGEMVDELYCEDLLDSTTFFIR